MLKESKWNKYKIYFGSVCLLLSVSLFIPAPKSEENEVYAFSLVQIIQILLFIISRLASKDFNKSKNLTRVLLETMAYTYIVAEYISLLNLA